MSDILGFFNIHLRFAGCVLTLFIGLSQAHADACSALRAQLGGGNAVPAHLTRQLQAIKALERQRQCSGRSSGGFFDPCRDLAGRRSSVEREIQAASGRGNGTAIRARLSALGCTQMAARQDRRKSDRPLSSTGQAMLYCVRLKDGYYFPAPNAQFVNAGYYDNTLDRCRYICNDKAMDVYELDDIGRETEEMASVKTRQSYKDLPSAFAYRDEADFQGCDLPRYYRRADEMRARTVTPKNMEAAVIPLPQAKPELLDGTVTAYVLETTEATPSTRRKVRVVGAPFLPNQANPPLDRR
jgi:hypothetical protein